MKKLISPYSLLFFVYLLSGCYEVKKDTRNDKDKLDSFSMAKYGKSHDERVKEMVKETISKAKLDTVGLSKAPIKVLKARFFNKEYSNYRDIRLTFKNVTDKKISAIKFQWQGADAFGEPAEMGGPIEGFGGGFTDKIISPNMSNTLEWSISSSDGKKVKLAWPTEVVFDDGTKWKIGAKH